MSYCWQDNITDAAFEYLKGVECYCAQATITGAAFQYLKVIMVLNMRACRAVCFQAARDAGLPVSEGNVYEFE
jgi:hypothetical protein